MQPTANQLAPRRHADWGRAAEGIQLAGIAVFLLLNTTGLLPWSFWLDAIALWPVLIMSAGIKVAFERTRAPWLLLLGPACVLGSLAWVAQKGRPDLPVGPWVESTQPRTSPATKLELAGHVAGTQLRLTSTSLDETLLVSARSSGAPDGAKLQARVDEGAARIEMKGGWRKGGSFFLTPWRKQRWEIDLPAELPLRLELNGAGVRTTADLSRGVFDGGRLSGVFLAFDLRLPATARPVKLEMDGVFNALTVSVPEGTPVQVVGVGLPLNAVDWNVKGAAGVPGYEIRLRGVFSSVTAEAREADRTAPTPAERMPAEAPPTPTSR